MFKTIKKTALISATLLITSSALFFACDNSAVKNNDQLSDEKIIEEASMKTSEWLTFKGNTETVIEANKEKIKLHKEKIKNSGTPNINNLRQKRIETLEARNIQLYNKLYEYKGNEMQADWAQFKADVEKELNEMEQAFIEFEKEMKN